MSGETTLCLVETTKSRPDGTLKDMYRFCCVKRKVFVLSVMLCGFMCFTLYTLSFSCCVVINSGLEQALRERDSNYINIDNNNEDYPPRQRYQTDLTDIQKSQHKHNRFARKTLVHDSIPLTYESHDHRRSHRRRTYPDGYVHRHRGSGFRKAEEDELNGYTVDEEREPDSSDVEEDYTEPKSQRANDRHREKEPKNTILRTNRHGSKKLPEAIIIGVKKGGTRALLEFLRVHPDIRSPGPEPHFFDRHYHRGIEWYRYVLYMSKLFCICLCCRVIKKILGS